jgi:hypothetical protein
MIRDIANDKSNEASIGNERYGKGDPNEYGRSSIRTLDDRRSVL